MKIDLGGGWCLRDLARGDLDRLVSLGDNPRVAANLRDRFPQPYTRADGKRWIAEALEDRPPTHFAIAGDEGLVGVIGVVPGSDVHRRSAEIGFWLGEPYWGRGIATRAVQALSEWAFGELDLLRLFAGVYETNPASARVLEKAGYRCEARLRRAVVKQGRTLDAWLYARLREGAPAERRGYLEPGPFAELVRQAPLVAIDLIVRDEAGRVLLGLRSNRPARGSWFVPGGRVRKDEALDDALGRLCEEELGERGLASGATLLGVFEHRYDDNFAGLAGFGTHYVVLAVELRGEVSSARLPDAQHERYRFRGVEELLVADDVHDHVKVYFRGTGATRAWRCGNSSD